MYRNVVMLSFFVIWACLASTLNAEVGLVTWLHWSNQPSMLRIETSNPSVKASVAIASNNKLLNTVQELKFAGWNYTSDGFIETPPRTGGKKIAIKVTGLPAGVQDVYVQYFSQPQVPGSTWYYSSAASLDNVQNMSHKSQLSYQAPNAHIIRGTGKYDPKTIYEVKIGSKGTIKEPVTSVTIYLERYIWAEISKVSSIRIQTDPSIDYATTQEPSPENRRIRTNLLNNGPMTQDGNPVYGVKVVSGTLKVRPKSFASLTGQLLSNQINISAARGEYENSQIVLYSPSRDIHISNLIASDLRDKDGHSISSTNIIFAPVGYVIRKISYDSELHGYWPDPILTFLKDFTILQHNIQSLWYRVYVPKGTPAGLYKGKVTINSKNAPSWDVQVNVTVRDFDMPKMPNLRTVFGVNRSSYFEMDYKMNPGSIYHWWDEWVKELPEWAKRGATAINVGYITKTQCTGPKNLPSKKLLDEYCKKINQRLKALEAAGLRDKAYMYIFDEATSEWHPAMRLFSETIAKRFPDLMLITTANDPTWGEATNLKKIKGWVPLLYQYDYKSSEEARKKGKQVWWYVCDNSPNKPYPNLALTNTGMDIRIMMGFMAYAYKTDGFLYYASVLNWGSQAPITSGPYTQWVTTGNGQLYQPGPNSGATFGEYWRDAKVGLPSIRLENFRDGLEDYDYLFMARKMMIELKKKNISDDELIRLENEIKQYFDPNNNMVKALDNFSQDTSKLENVRDILAKYIEKAAKKLFSSKQ